MGISVEQLYSLKKSWRSHLPTNIFERFGGDGEIPARIVCEGIRLVEFFCDWGGFGIGGEHCSPMGILLKGVVENEGLCLCKQQKSTEHIISGDIINDVRPRPLVTRGYAEMMVAETMVLSQIRLGAGKSKQAGFSIMTNFIALQGWTTIRSVDNDTGEEAFGGSAMRYRTGRIQNIQC